MYHYDNLIFNSVLERKDQNSLFYFEFFNI